MGTASPTPGEWEVYRCREAEPDQACGIRVVGSAVVNNGYDDVSVATMVVSDTNREECCHHMRLADAMHIVALHNYAHTCGQHGQPDAWKTSLEMFDPIAKLPGEMFRSGYEVEVPGDAKLVSLTYSDNSGVEHTVTVNHVDNNESPEEVARITRAKTEDGE